MNDTSAQGDGPPRSLVDAEYAELVRALLVERNRPVPPKPGTPNLTLAQGRRSEP